jgi:hypothetical protein
MEIPLRQRTKGDDEEKFVYIDKQRAGGGLPRWFKSISGGNQINIGSAK